MSKYLNCLYWKSEKSTLYVCPFHEGENKEDSIIPELMPVADVVYTWISALYLWKYTEGEHFTSFRCMVHAVCQISSHIQICPYSVAHSVAHSGFSIVWNASMQTRFSKLKVRSLAAYSLSKNWLEIHKTM